MTPSTGLENLYKVLNNKDKSKALEIERGLSNYFKKILSIKNDHNTQTVTVKLENDDTNIDLVEHLRSVINLTQYHLYLSYPNDTIELILVRR